MKYKLTVLMFVMAFLSGCLNSKSILIENHPYYDSEAQAKFRFFGSYGNLQIKYYTETSCLDWSREFSKSKATGFNNGLPKKVKNISIGMPPTERSVKALNDRGIIFRDSFKEFVIDANTETVFVGEKVIAMDSYHSTCHVAVAFTPEAGRNYQAYYYEQGGHCHLAIEEILDVDFITKLAPLKEVNLEKCN